MTGKSRVSSSLRWGSPRCSNSVLGNLYLFSSSLTSALFCVSFSFRQLQAYTDLYQGILEKTMSSSFPEIISNPQRTLKSAIWITCWWRNLTIWLTALPEYEECGKGRSQGKMAFIRRKENGGWVVKGRCPSSSALPVTLNLNHLQEPLELISIPWLNGKIAPHLAPSYCSVFLFCFFLPEWRTDFSTLWAPTTWMNKIYSAACNDFFIAVTNHHVNK